MKTIHITLLLITIVWSSFAQQQFEGKIIYDMSFPTTKELNTKTMKMAPKEIVVVTMFLKGHKMRMETLTLLNNSISFYDTKSKTLISLMDIKGQKTAVVTDKEEMEKEEKQNPVNEKPEIKFLDETKEIAGYPCKKAEIVLNKKTMEILIVYYTDKIKSDAVKENPKWLLAHHKEIPGVVLEYKIMNQKDEIFNVTAKQVSAELIADNNFIIPADYKKVSEEKMNKLGK